MPKIVFCFIIVQALIMKKKGKDEIRNAGREEQMNRGRGREEGKN